MLFIDNESVTDPRINLAIEEYSLRNLLAKEPILFFYINEPTVIIGRNQNALEEIDPEYVRNQGIHIVRRLSGGGAVYHDLGNLNYSFITQGTENLHNFAKFTDPVIKMLSQFGVDAELRERSSIFAMGKKISGNAQYMASGRMFSHGTLLFDTNLEEMLKALNPRQLQIESKAVQSVRNLVLNLREHLPEGMDIEQLKQELLNGIFEGDLRRCRLTAGDWDQIHRISAERYRQWDWNIGRAPKFNVKKSARFAVGKIDAHIDIEKGRIQSMKFHGDFAGKAFVSELEQQLLGIRYDKDALGLTLEDIDITHYFGDLGKQALLDLLY